MDIDTLFSTLKTEAADHIAKKVNREKTASALASAVKADSDAATAVDAAGTVKAKTLKDLHAALDAAYGS